VISEHSYLAAAGCMYVTEHAVYMLLHSPFTLHSHFTKALVTCEILYKELHNNFLMFYITCASVCVAVSETEILKKALAKHFQTVVTCKEVSFCRSFKTL